MPASWQLLTSPDGLSWTAATIDANGALTNAVDARYMRVELTRDPATDRAGIREVVVN